MTMRQFLKNIRWIMAELDFETIAKTMKDPNVTKNTTNIMEGLKHLDEILSQGDKVVSFIEKLEQRPLVSMLVRLSAKQAGGGEEMFKPLSSEKPQTIKGIEPKSKLHEAMFNQLNSLSEVDLQKFLEQQKGKVNDSVQAESRATDNQ